MAEQLSAQGDQMENIDKQIQENEAQIVKNRAEIKKSMHFNTNFVNKELPEEIQQLQQILELKKDYLAKMEQKEESLEEKLKK